MKRLGIRAQILMLTFLPLLVVVFSLEGYFLYDRFADMDKNLLQQSKLLAHQLAGSAEYGVFSNNVAFLEGVAKNTLQYPDARGVYILDDATRVLHKAHKTAVGSSGVNPQDHSDEYDQVNLLNPVKIDAQSIWIYQPIVPAQIGLDDFDAAPGTRQLGAVVVEVSRADTESSKSRMLWLTVLLTVTILPFPLYAIFLASRNITFPIRRLNDAVRSIAGGDLNARVYVAGGELNELGNLAKCVNEMAAQLQTERSVLEQRIEEATCALREKKEEAERASHDMSHFLAVASHDLRQPLHALGLYIAELQRRTQGGELQHLVQQVERSTESLSTLLNALLDISKLDAGAILPHMQACDVESLFKHVAADYQMLASLRNIRLVIRPCCAYVNSDPVLLERILTNLVSNALRYTPHNGCVMIACRRRGAWLRIEVRDSGIGISRKDQASVFREFFQLAQPQLDSSKGLGLGLAIVDRLVRLLGHRITLRSAPGRGTVFAVEAPIAVMPEVVEVPSLVESVAVAQSEESPLYGKQLLVVDDDEMVLNSTASILHAWGCQATLATSLAQVEQYLRDGQRWDIVISDYQLEKNTTGLDVIATVRRGLKTNLPCLLISGDTGPAVLKLAAVGGHHLLHKPVKPAKLRSLLIHLLDAAVGDAKLGGA